MVQIIEGNKRPSIGEKFSRAVGAGLEIGGGMFKEHEAKKLQQQQMAQENQALKQLTGMDFSGVTDPKVRQEAFKQAFGARQEQDYLNQIMGQPRSQGIEQTRGNEPSEGFNKQGTSGQFGLKDLPEEKLQALLGTSRFKEPAKAEIKRRQQEKQQQEVKQLYRDAGFSEEEAEERAATSSPATARTIFREKTEKPLFESEGEKLEAKRVSELADEISKEYTSSKSENMRLDRMEELSKKDTLSTPLMMKALDKLGLPISVLGNPDTEEYAKLEADFVRDVSKVFPGQIRVFEIQAYLKTIPGLANTPEGRKTIIRNRRLMNEAKEIRYNEYKKILKENNGKKPPNLDVLLEERTGPKMAELGERFQEGMESAIEQQGPKVKMFDESGKAYNIPSHLIPQAQQQGLIFR